MQDDPETDQTGNVPDLRSALRAGVSGAFIGLLLVLPPLARIWIAELDGYFISAEQDREILPWREILSWLAPPEVLAILIVIGMGLLVWFCSRLGDFLGVDRKGAISAALRWSVKSRFLWVVGVVIAAVAVGLSAELPMFQELMGVTLACTLLLIIVGPWWMWRRECVSPSFPILWLRRQPLGKAAWTAAGLLGLRAGLWLLGIWVESRIGGVIAMAAWFLLDSLISLALTMLLLAVLLRTNTLPEAWRGRRAWLRRDLFLDLIALHWRLFLLLLPAAATLVWLTVWFVYEVPQLEAILPNGPASAYLSILVALGKPIVTYWWLSSAPVVCWLLLALGRLAWLHGVQDAREQSG
ncbi:MAG: hypothetical protein AB7E72_20035 [Lysobacterales bacterium]